MVQIFCAKVVIAFSFPFSHFWFIRFLGRAQFNNSETLLYISGAEKDVQRKILGHKKMWKRHNSDVFCSLELQEELLLIYNGIVKVNSQFLYLYITSVTDSYDILY